MVMNARDAEAALLERCVLVASPARSANAAQDTAQNAREANVFRLAALVARTFLMLPRSGKRPAKLILRRIHKNKLSCPKCLEKAGSSACRACAMY